VFSSTAIQASEYTTSRFGFTNVGATPAWTPDKTGGLCLMTL
jgi:hypothetical protein